MENQGKQRSWNDPILVPTEDGVEGHRKQEAAGWTALCHAPNHEELSSGHSCEFDVCGAVVLDHPQKTTNDLKQVCFSITWKIVDARMGCKESQ